LTIGLRRRYPARIDSVPEHHAESALLVRHHRAGWRTSPLPDLLDRLRL